MKRQTAVTATDILLPKSCDLSKWSVVACDQFTSQPTYWQNLAKEIGDAPSALHLILPECYLSGDSGQAAAKIHTKMKEYLQKDLFTCLPHSMILCERTLPSGKKRLGLVAAVDLEAYSFRAEDQSPIRATEGTVLDRLPPRVKIRSGAPLELSHIMLLLDDPDKTVVEAAYQKKEELSLCYDFSLSGGGGRMRGWMIADDAKISDVLTALLNPKRLTARYGSEKPLLLLAGDGNHSLAAAKQWWEACKEGLSKAEQENHPARYALCELVNLYDSALVFEPIHRVMFDCDFVKLKTAIQNKLDGEGKITLLSRGEEFVLSAPSDTADCYRIVQEVLDCFTAEEHCKIDYVHGEKSVRNLTNDGAVGILMPALSKTDLFPYVIHHGALPRKTFSMGEAEEKRYYTESRKIVSE